MVRILGGLQNWELQVYDQFVRIRPNFEGVDDKFLVITVDEGDIQYQDRDKKKYNRTNGSLSDKALLALLKKIRPYKPALIASDIVHDFEFEKGLQENLKQNKNYISICRASGRASNKEGKLEGIKPPTNFASEQIGFTNFPEDFDEVIRRQIVGMESDDICPTEFSLGLRIALSYLGESGSETSDGFVKIKNEILKPLESNSGGYQLPKKEIGGYQILLNYRALNPKQVKLREILSDSLNTQLSPIIKDKIILIGVVDGKSDLHLTPYGSRISGVLVHAQMASQIISAVQEKRPFMRWLPEWLETIWTIVWSLLVNILPLSGYAFFSTKLKVAVILIPLLFMICYFAFLAAIWIPFIPPFIALMITAGTFSLTQTIFRHKDNNKS